MVDAGIFMALMRGLHLAATLSLLGTAGFRIWILPEAAPAALRRRLIRLWWISGAVALLAGCAWFTLQAAEIAGAGNASDVWAALPLVAGHTRYGTMLMLRFMLLIAAVVAGGCGGEIARSAGTHAAPVMGRFSLGSASRAGVLIDGGSGQTRSLWLYPALVLTAIAVCLQGYIGHAGAAEGAVGDGLILSVSLHLLAAGLWLGALIPLWLSLRWLPPASSVSVCERFSPIGLACVLVLAGFGSGGGQSFVADRSTGGGIGGRDEVPPDVGMHGDRRRAGYRGCGFVPRLDGSGHA
jgi:putative copper resistance protein D